MNIRESNKAAISNVQRLGGTLEIDMVQIPVKDAVGLPPGAERKRYLRHLKERGIRTALVQRFIHIPLHPTS
jgi:hypothetical protein